MKWGLGGFRPWFFQRASAVYMLGYLLFIVGVFGLCPPQNYQQWIDWLARPEIWMASALFFVALFIHAWVGLRDVILDYVHPVVLRLLLLSALGAFLLSLTLWVFRALFAVV